MAAYFLGIDIGGTKSHALIADEHGQALALATGRARIGDDESKKYSDLSEIVRDIVGDVLHQVNITMDQIQGAGFGIAGFDWPSQRKLYEQAITSTGLNSPFEAHNDAVIGLLAGSQRGWGVGLAAGTGCNCWGIDQQRRMGQVTGMGTWMGEGAGASELVLWALQAVSRAWSLRGPRTELASAFCKHTGAKNTLDLLEGLTMGRYDLHAGVAPVVFRVANEGDQVAYELIKQAGRELGSLAVGVIRQLQIQEQAFDVVMSGSFWKGSSILAEEMKRIVCLEAPQAEFIRLEAPPVIGGVVLGMQVAGYDAKQTRLHLIGSTMKFM